MHPGFWALAVVAFVLYVAMICEIDQEVRG